MSNEMKKVLSWSSRAMNGSVTGRVVATGVGNGPCGCDGNAYTNKWGQPSSCEGNKAEFCVDVNWLMER